MRLPLTWLHRGTSRAVLPVAVVVLAILGATSSPAWAGGPDATLCHSDSSRVSVPVHFTVDACFDGAVLTLKNRMDVVVAIDARTSTGTVDSSNEIRNSDLPSTAAMLNTISTGDNVLPPGSYLQIHLGGEEAWITVGPDVANNKLYALQSLLLSYLPLPKAAGVYDALAGLVEEINNAYTNRRTCDEHAKNFLAKAGCSAGMAGNILFAIGRAGAKGGQEFVHALEGEPMRLLTSTVWFGWDQMGVSRDLDTIANSNPSLHIAAASEGGGATGGGTGGGGGGPSPTVQLAQGPAAPAGYRFAIALSGFGPNISAHVTCFDSASPNGFYSVVLATDSSGGVSTSSFCYSGDGPDHWVVVDGHESNHVTWGGSPQPPQPPLQPQPAPTTHAETVGGDAHTWTNYANAGGEEGPMITSGSTVQIACSVPGFRVSDGDTYWYQIASSPWDGHYYVSADAFYNNGRTSGDLHGTPFVDAAVPAC